MLALFPEPDIQVSLHRSHYFLGVVLLIKVEVIDIIRNSVNLFFGTNLNLLVIILLFQYSVDINIHLTVILLPLLLSEHRRPVQIELGNNDIVQFVIVVVILQQLLTLLERTELDLVLKLLLQQSHQVLETLDLVLLEKLMVFKVNVLLFAFALQKGKSGLYMTVDLLDTRLQAGVGAREHVLRVQVARTLHRIETTGVVHSNSYSNNIISI